MHSSPLQPSPNNSGIDSDAIHSAGGPATTARCTLSHIVWLADSPDRWRRQLDAVTARIAEVDGAAAGRPFDRRFELDVMFRETIEPRLELVATNGERDMSGAGSSVRRWRVPAAHRRCCRIEDQKHRVTTSEEDMSALFAGVEGQSEHVAVETFGRVEIVDVKRRLQNREGHASDCTGLESRDTFTWMGSVKLDHVQLAAPPACEADARRFFGDLLGLEEIEKPETLRGRGGVWFSLGTQHLHIGVEDPFSPAKKAHPALRLSSKDLDDVAAALELAGEVIEWDTSLADVRRFYTTDPWGNRIELIADAP